MMKLDVLLHLVTAKFICGNDMSAAAFRFSFFSSSKMFFDVAFHSSQAIIFAVSNYGGFVFLFVAILIRYSFL